MSKNGQVGIAEALARIPAARFLLSAAYEDSRGGVIVDWVQRCSHEPPMIMVAVRKGHTISPLIRDARTFAVCKLPDDERQLNRHFAATEPNEDPFVGLDVTAAPSGSPLLHRAEVYLECTLTRHVDIESEYELYVGEVTAGGGVAPE